MKSRHPRKQYAPMDNLSAPAKLYAEMVSLTFALPSWQSSGVGRLSGCQRSSVGAVCCFRRKARYLL